MVQLRQATSSGLFALALAAAVPAAAQGSGGGDAAPAGGGAGGMEGGNATAGGPGEVVTGGAAIRARRPGRRILPRPARRRARMQCRRWKGRASVPRFPPTSPPAIRTWRPRRSNGSATMSTMPTPASTGACSAFWACGAAGGTKRAQLRLAERLDFSFWRSNLQGRFGCGGTGMARRRLVSVLGAPAFAALALLVAIMQGC